MEKFNGGFFLSNENPQNTLPGVDQRFTKKYLFEKLLFFSYLGSLMDIGDK